MGGRAQPACAEARPIKKGKLKSPSEFGRKVILEETEERIIVGHGVLAGNPADRSLLEDFFPVTKWFCAPLGTDSREIVG